MAPPAEITPPVASTGLRRFFRLGGTHSAFSASLLLMASSLLSGVFGLLRGKLVAKYFGAGPQTAAYFAAFQLPDMILYLLIGGAGSAAFVTILTRYRAANDGLEGEAEGDQAISAVLNVLGLGLLCAILLGELLAPLYVRIFLPGFAPAEAALCAHVTRILLVGPLFFFAGGVFASRLLVRKIFVYQAIAPVVYSGGIVFGAILLHHRFGIDSLAIGAMVGALLGPFALNYLGARSVGLRWSPILDVRHPAVKEWLRLSLPLMLGQSLTTTDGWIRQFIISGDAANLSRLNYARQLFTAPMNVLGPAAGIASLPFFAALWSKGDVAQFSAAVDRSVSRMIAVSLLLTGWMIGLAPLLVDLMLRGGSFASKDAASTTLYFLLYTSGLFLWTSQSLYARAFFGAGDTLTPMLSGTAVTLISIPVYMGLYRAFGPAGLAAAAGVGMALHTGALAVLLHRKRMVSIAELEWGELGRSLAAATAGCLGILAVLHLLPAAKNHVASLMQAALASLAWAAVVFAMLRATSSKLLDVLLRRRAARGAVQA